MNQYSEHTFGGNLHALDEKTPFLLTIVPGLGGQDATYTLMLFRGGIPGPTFKAKERFLVDFLSRYMMVGDLQGSILELEGNVLVRTAMGLKIAAYRHQLKVVARGPSDDPWVEVGSRFMVEGETMCKFSHWQSDFFTSVYEFEQIHDINLFACTTCAFSAQSSLELGESRFSLSCLRDGQDYKSFCNSPDPEVWRQASLTAVDGMHWCARYQRHRYGQILSRETNVP